MDTNNLYAKLCACVGEENVKVDEPMKAHTTFRIGGPADYFVMPSDRESVKKAIDVCKEADVAWYVVGNGSNLLVGDKGYRGVIIQIGRNLSDIEVVGDKIRVQAGAMLSKTGAMALEAELTGMEFASGIPGSLGGAVVMNAGAYGGEMKDILISVTVLTAEGEIRSFSVDELELGYRKSILMQNKGIVLDAELQLKKGEKKKIREIMDDLRSRRIEKQPLEYPSAGSTFKRPEGYFAGKLIMDAGFGDFKVGGAMVSGKHCGFVVNAGDATAMDVIKLMDTVRDKVKELYDVVLEPEVRFLGEF